MPRRAPFSRLTVQGKSIWLPGITMFGRYQYAASFSGLRPHAHGPAIEICFLERGEQTYRVGGRLHRLRGHDQFFTLPGEMHDTAGLPQERGILYWIILDLSERNLLGLAPGPATQLKRELKQMPHRHFRGHPDCPGLLSEVAGLFAAGQRTGRLAARDRLVLQSLLLRYLAVTIHASGLGAHGRASPLIQRVLRYIDAHLGEAIHVPSLAQEARLSESRFKARFKDEIGVPPAEFWLRHKIEKAILLLKSRSVTEVSYQLGFSSSQYFATVFKRYTLSKPSDFHTSGATDFP